MKEMMEMNCLKNMNRIYKSKLLINLLRLFLNLGSIDPKHQAEDLVIRRKRRRKKNPPDFLFIFFSHV